MPNMGFQVWLSASARADARAADARRSQQDAVRPDLDGIGRVGRRGSRGPRVPNGIATWESSSTQVMMQPMGIPPSLRRAAWIGGPALRLLPTRRPSRAHLRRLIVSCGRLLRAPLPCVAAPAWRFGFGSGGFSRASIAVAARCAPPGPSIVGMQTARQTALGKLGKGPRKRRLARKPAGTAPAAQPA